MDNSSRSVSHCHNLMLNRTPSPPPTVINDPQSKAIAYHSCKDVLHWAMCGFFLFVFLNETMDRVRQHTQMHTLSKLCSPSVPLCMQLLRGAENKRAHLCDAGLQWPCRSPALLAFCLGAAFDRKLGDKLNRWHDKKLAVQNSSRRIFEKSRCRGS